MYIITQVAPLEESKEKIYRVNSPADEEPYLEAGYRCGEREYKITSGHKEYIVICPEYRDDKKGGEPIVIIPGFLMPGRRYSVEVYLYAIDIYSSNLEKGQRKAAEETRKRFDLATFAHTTLGRALKALCGSLDEAGEANADIEEGDAVMLDGSGSGGAPGFPTPRSTRRLRDKAAQFLREAARRLEWHAAVAEYRKKAWDWFLEHQRLLL